VALAWSGGKNSSLALAALQNDPAFQPLALVTTITGDYDRISMHGVRRSVLDAQVEELALPLFEAIIPADASNAIYEEALTLVANALDLQKRGGKFLFVPALMRVKGLILASRSREDYPEAEASFLSAIDWAKRQSATLFELKAATDLAELLLEQRRVPEAYKHLRAALDRMPTGIVSPDHERALQVLNRLQSGTKAAG